jgi:hypothetical protein
MKLRIRQIAIALAVAAGAGGSGCSNLVVKKVPLEKRITGTDHQQGFRYYLNRPYLYVRDPILIVERKTLVQSTPVGDTQTVTFLEGERKGQSVSLADLKVKNDDTFRAVTASDLSKIRAALAPAAASASSTPMKAASAPPGTRDARVAQSSANDHHGNKPNQPAGPSSQGQPQLPRIPAVPSLALAPLPAGVPGVGGATGAGGGAAGAGADSNVDTDASSTKMLTDAKLSDNLPADDVLPADFAIQIFYLPDLDEQYAIKSKNLLAKSTFALAFRNGTELTEVDAEHDATTVTIALLDLLQTAIGTASQVAQTKIQQDAKKTSSSGATPGGGAAGGGRAPLDKAQFYQLVERVYIRQGVYRLNKPWEISGPGFDMPRGMGLLAKLGLPTESDVCFTNLSSL